MKIIIIGAGISGLALAWSLRRQHGDRCTIAILEKSSRPGGWIRSSVEGGFFFEQGPRSCRSKGAGAATLQLIESLGLQDDVILASSAARHRFIYHEGSMQHVPSTFLEFIRSPLMKGIFPALCKECFISSRKDGDESIAGFMERRFSAEIANRLVDPMVSGIYAGDIDRLSLKACFPELHKREQQHGSLVKSMIKSVFQGRQKSNYSPFVKRVQHSPIFTLRHGMESLVKALAEALKEELQLETPVAGIDINQKGVEIHLENGACMHADQVYLASPAQATAKILGKSCPEIASQLAKIESASVAVVSMGWKENVLPLSGFGYLVPSKEKEDVLGVVWDSSVFPEQNRNLQETRITAMLGGRHRPDLLALSDNELMKLVGGSLQKHLNITASPESIKVFRAKEAIPQYDVGHLERLAKIEQSLAEWSFSKVKLIGSSYHGVSVNDCIAIPALFGNVR